MLMVGLMLVTLVWALLHPDENIFADHPEGSARYTDLAFLGGILTVIQTCIFATAFQFAVPAIVGVTQNKKRLASILGYAVSFVLVSNLVLALLTATYFGEETEASNNLNWLSFHGGNSATQSTISHLVSSYIVWMAAIDGLAVYPLNTIPLAEGLMGFWYGTHRRPEDWRSRGVFYVLASLPQGVAALWIRDLGRIAQYAGIFTVLSYTVAPALLQIASQKRLQQVAGDCPGSWKTSYSHPWLSHKGVAQSLLVMSILLMTAVMLDTVVDFTGSS
jgi:hypothetical protein